MLLFTLACGLLSFPALAADDLPKRCYPQLAVAFIEAVDGDCPSLKVTFKAREFVVAVKKQIDDPACDAAARDHVKQYRKEMPNAWCLATVHILNGDPGNIMLEFRR